MALTRLHALSYVILAIIMLGSHCRAIRYECHDWPFVADRETSLKCQVWIRGDASRYVLVRFDALG